MKRVLKTTALALGVVLGGLGAREALSSTSVTGIFGDCQMTTHRAKVDATGKPSGEPVLCADVKMVGLWTPRAFRRSWDGKTVLAHTFEGFRVNKGTENQDYKIQLFHRNFWWGPDNKKFMVWLPGGIAILNADDLGPTGGPPKFKIVYRAPAGRFPIGIAWSPSGSEIFVSEHFEEGGNTKSAIKKVSVESGAATEILVHPIELIFYMPADTWYEDGSGPKAKKSPILFGAKDGVFVMDSDGGGKTKLADLPCEGIGDVMWDPSQKEQFLLLWRRGFPAPAPSKKVFKGLYLVKVEEAKKVAAAKKADDYSFMEEITDGTEGVHTLFFSPKGKYIGWAEKEGAHYRETAKTEKATTVSLGGITGPVKGLAWDDKETKLAIAVGNKLVTYDLASKGVTQIATTGEKGFVAEPFWRGDEIVYSSFVDASLKKTVGDPVPPK